MGRDDGITGRVGGAGIRGRVGGGDGDQRTGGWAVPVGSEDG